MRNRIFTYENGKRSIHWMQFGLYSMMVYALAIGTLELICVVLTGGVSPLLLGFGFVAGTLLMLRKLGEGLAYPAYLSQIDPQ